MIGQTISHYRILEKIGEGGMGEVYLAEDTSLDRKVALKFLPEFLQRDEIAPQRFLREAKAAAALDHPFICHIHEIGEGEAGPFIAMEYVDGETLKDRLAREPLTYREVLRIGSEISEAVQKAHEQGIIHRDLKPSNIMLTQEGRVKVMDFGLAKKVITEEGTEQDITSALTREGATLGTLTYMSPEQLRGEKVNARSDIFSLGILLYEMLLGKHPFRRKGPMETASAILKDEPEFPAASQAGPGIALHKTIRSMLAKDPAQRCQSIQEVHATLETLWQEMTPVSWLFKWRYWAAGLSVIAILFVALVYLIIIPPVTPKAINPQRLTSDGRVKAFMWLATVGRRVYYSEVEDPLWIGEKGVLHHVSVNGGESVAMNPWPDEDHITLVMDISPDFSELLVISDKRGDFSPWNGPLWILPLPSGTPRRLGNVRATCACYSPDGQQIAFTNVQDQTLCVVRIDGTNVRQVITEEDIPWLWSWSSENRLCYGFVDWGKGKAELREIDIDGSNRQHLVPDWGGIPVFGRYTPDGKWLVFSAEGGAGHFTRRNLWAIPRKAGYFSRKASEPVQVTDGLQRYMRFTFSPDGKKIFALLSNRQGELVQYRPDIGNWVPYREIPERSALHLDFSPDGQWVAYVQYPEAVLWKGRVGGTQALPLTEAGGLFVYRTNWSPDGKKIAFAANFSGVREGLRAYVVESEGGPARRVLNEEYGQLGVCWSPWGNILVGSESGEAPLRLIDLETGAIQDIAGSEGMCDCAWSPDGRYIATHTHPSYELALYDTENQEWTRLEGCRGRELVWSPDSEYLYFVRGDGILRRLSPSEREAEEVIAIGDAVNNWYGFDPDGKLLITKEEGEFEVVALDFEY